MSVHLRHALTVFFKNPNGVWYRTMEGYQLLIFVFALLLSWTSFTDTAITGTLGYVELSENSKIEFVYSQDGNAFLNTSLHYVVDNSSATNNGGGNYTLASDPVIAGQKIVGHEAFTNGTNLTRTAPLMTLLFTMKKLDADTFQLLMYVENSGAMMAGNVKATIDLFPCLKIDYFTTNYWHYGKNISMINGRWKFEWNIGNLNTESANDTFSAEIQQEYCKYKNRNYFTMSLTYTNDTNLASQEYTMTAKVCLERFVTLHKSILYQHGFTALTFFMAFILGCIIVALIFLICYKTRGNKLISPAEADQEKLMLERGRTIMMDEDDAVKRGGHTINNYSVIQEGDSIVGVLGMKDKMQMHRELDSLDIVNTVNVDTDLEKERNDASIATTELLIKGLHSNNDISKQTMDSALGNIRSRRVHMDKQHDEEYKREMKKLYKKISAKNRAMMNTLLERQRLEKKELVSATQDLPAEERNELIKLMNEQHMSEQNAETYKLKLEQDEEAEKLRKEFAIRSRMGIKEIQLQALNDVKDQGKLTDPQMKWLMAEHQKNQKKLEGMYDEEISKQRMSLEEKLAKRKALAQSAEKLEEDNDDLLNTVAGQQVNAIDQMKKKKAISDADANQLLDEARTQMLAIKDKMEKQRADQESELHKKLSNLKKKRLNDLAKEQEAELREYDRKCQDMQTDGPVDPIAYAEGRLKLVSLQRVERNNLEEEIDKDHTDQLCKVRSEVAMQTQTELRAVSDSLKTKLSGDDQAKLEKLMRDHRNEAEALQVAQQKNRDKQLQKLQDRLQESREQWNQRKEAEKVEQEQLREYEDTVINKLVNSQVSMSDAERERILKEHEKQMVKLENSLTLNKLRQKRMIEEKVAQRRAQQMEKLQLKQNKEKEVQKRKIDNNAEDSGDEEVLRQRVDMMKGHVEQKMAVLQGRKLDWDTELESIRIEMLKERSLALKEQEERLGALVAELQLSKAKELAKIEDQQRAIHNLKTNLIDDLNARGVLSDPETQAVIRRHQEEQEQLNQRLESQRQQQESLLKQKLQQRLEQREKTMIQQQDEELKNLVAPNKTAGKIKKMLLIHKHMVAMEKMRNQLEREISQTLEQVRYEYEICKRKAIQDQEMEFIAGLVRVGTIPKEELESVLRMLYPGKSEAEFKAIFDRIFDSKLQSQQNMPQTKEEALTTRGIKLLESFRGSKKQKDNFQSALEQQHHYSQEHFEDNSRFRPSSRTFEEPSRFGTPQFSRQSLSDTQPFRPSSRQSYDDRPHPLEEEYSRQGSLRQQNGHAYANPIMEEDEDVVQAQYVSGDGRGLPSKLPPLDMAGKKKKKKKFLKKMAQSPRADDDD